MRKKVVRILALLIIIIGIIFSVSTYAGTGKLYTNLAALNPDGIGYGIGDPTNQGKYIWHMSTYNSASGGLSEKQKNLYCLKADYGASWERFTLTSPILEYNLVYDMQRERQEILNKIVYNENDADEVIKSLLNVTGSQYREILWLLDNMYIKGENNKEEFLAKAGVAKDEYDGTTTYYNTKTGTEYGEEILTEDDIIAIQRVAIWTFTNGGDFDKTQNQNWLQITSDASNYNLLDRSRENMAIDVYKYLVSSAKTGASLYTAENNYTINDSPVAVDLNGLTEENGKYKIDAQNSDSNYIIGPIVLKKNNDFAYKISLSVKNENDVEIDSSKYSITDSNGTSLGDNISLKDLVNKTEGFFIKIDKNLATKFNIYVNVAHYNTTKNLYLQGTEETNEIKLNAEQPIAEISREEVITTMEFVSEPKQIEVPDKPFDLALRKYITKINDKELSSLGLETRVPQIKTETIETNKTATYNHRKDPVKVEEDDVITYAITVYNEGEKIGYASQIIDQLPTGLVYIPSGTIKSKDKNGIDKNEYATIYETSNNRVIFNIINSEENPAKELQPFENGNLDSETIEIKCKVTYKIKADTSNILTNVAWINKEYDAEAKKTITTTVGEDRDSEPQNAPKVSKDNMENYKGNAKNPDDLSNSKYFYEGQQDDDDFEKVYVKGFDLALKKFITQVQENEITNRIPQPKIENKTISYEQTKDPLTVHVGDKVIYTIRIYNEGEINGYASEITDDIPEYLEYIPDDAINLEYKWKMYDENGVETENAEEAVNVKTAYLSKENGEENLIKALDGTELAYKDIKIAFKVKDPNSNAIIITNYAQISNDTDEDGNEIKDKDSETNKWNEGEDDQDIENIKVEYFDLSILKFVSKVIVQEANKETITETGYNGHEDPEPIVKVELHKKKIDNVTVKFVYGITVTNEGDIPGYATEITDYIPEGLRFDSSDNPRWTYEDNNVVSTTQLKDVILQPGESKTIEVTFTWINDKNNMGLKTNTVEISKDLNEYNVPDRDSTPDNKKDGEDDIDIANVMLAVSTGRTKTYFTLTLGLLAVIAVGVALIKKFVL